MTLLDIFNSKERFQKKLKRFIDSIEPVDKSKRERLKWKVQISGVHIDDLDPSGPPREIPFSREEYEATREEAEALGKLEYANDNEVEIWHLIRRWS